MHSSHAARRRKAGDCAGQSGPREYIDVTQIVCGKSWWEERVDAVTQAVEAVTMPLKMSRKKRKRISLNGRRQCFLIWSAAAHQQY
jgi:hypothetical protein